MNKDQVNSVLRSALKIAGAALAAHGMTKAAAFINAEDTIGLILTLVGLIISHYSLTDTKLIAKGDAAAQKVGSLAGVVFVLALLTLAMPAQAQTNLPPAITDGTNNALTLSPPSTNAPAPATVQGDVQNIIDIIKSGETNWYFIPYGLYAPGLQKKAGGGLAAAYPISQYVFGSLRMDYVNGGFWMPSGSATFQIPVKLTSWLTVSPFAYAGVGVPVSGATVNGVTLPGQTPKNNNGQPTAILGYGASIKLFERSTPATQWYQLDSLYIVADREEWTGFPGEQYRFGLALNKKF